MNSREQRSIDDGIVAWHFSEGDQLANGDGRVMQDGKALHVGGDIVPCQRGLHGSVRAIDALQYAQGMRVSRVRLFGTVAAHGDPVDKHAASNRLQLWHADAKDTLVRFAFWGAVLGIKAEHLSGMDAALAEMQAYADGGGTSITAIAAATQVVERSEYRSRWARYLALAAVAVVMYPRDALYSVAYVARNAGVKSDNDEEVNRELERRLLALQPAVKEGAQ